MKNARQIMLEAQMKARNERNVKTGVRTPKTLESVCNAIYITFGVGIASYTLYMIFFY